jgi:hypothetical protein
LIYEAKIMQRLKGCRGIAQPKAYGRIKTVGINFMVTEFLGPTLEDIFDICGR